MSTFPLPDLPPLSDEATQAPASRRNPLGFALPLLGAFALSRGGGGAEGLMEGLARGLQLGTAMREREEATAQRKTLIEEQRAERRAALRRDFLTNVSRALAGIDDPDEFDQAKGQLRGVAAEFGVRPEELDVYAFPASKRSKLKRARAGAVLNQLITSHGAGKVFGELLDTTVDVAGESLSVRQILKLAEFPIPRREVTRPVIEERPAPEVTGTGPGLALAGLPQRIQTGTETVTEEILPVISKRVTLGEYDPRFRNTPFARTQVPLDKDGDVDSAAIMRYYGEARNQGIPGFADPVSAAKGRFDQVMRERDDVRHRMDAIRTQMDQAKTEEQFRAGVQAWNRFVENISRGKGYLGFTQVPFDVPTAVAQWKADLAARRRRVGEGAARDTLTPAQARVVNQFDEVDKRIDSAQDRLATLLEPDDPRAKAIQTRIAELERRKAQMLRTHPWIAPFVGVSADDAPSDAARDALLFLRGGGRLVPADWNALSPADRTWLQRQGIQVPGPGSTLPPAPSAAAPRPTLAAPLSERQAQAIVDDAVRRRQPFPEARLRGLPPAVISALRQRYNAAMIPAGAASR